MELRLNSRQDFQKIWKNDFLGQQGLFIPGNRDFQLGREMSISLNVEGSSWGTARVVPVWTNQHGPNTPELPRGTFLILVSVCSRLRQQLDSLNI
ncbi:MAG: hypothetical protein ACOCPN_02495 [Desulfonatronovibrionaceae bacterium]